MWQLIYFITAPIITLVIFFAIIDDCLSCDIKRLHAKINALSLLASIRLKMLLRWEKNAAAH